MNCEKCGYGGAEVRYDAVHGETVLCADCYYDEDFMFIEDEDL